MLRCKGITLRCKTLRYILRCYATLWHKRKMRSCFGALIRTLNVRHRLNSHSLTHLHTILFSTNTWKGGKTISIFLCRECLALVVDNFLWWTLMGLQNFQTFQKYKIHLISLLMKRFVPVCFSLPHYVFIKYICISSRNSYAYTVCSNAFNRLAIKLQ